jgi:hypothetical protein
MKNNNGLIFFLLFIGIPLLVAGIVGFIINRDLDINGIRTEGTVVRMVVRSKTSSTSVTTYLPLISYRSKDGKDHEFESNIFYEDSGHYVRGTKLPVLYNPQNTDEAELEGSMSAWMDLFAGGGLGLVMCLGAVAVYRKGKKKTG